MQCGSVQPQRESEVGSQLAAMTRVQDRLDKAVVCLQERLSPILSRREPNPPSLGQLQKDAPDQIVCQFAGGLREKVRMLDSIANRIEQLTTDCEL